VAATAPIVTTESPTDKIPEDQTALLLLLFCSSTAAAIIFEIVEKGIAQGPATLSRFLQGRNVVVICS